MNDDELTRKAIELINKTKDLGVYKYSATRHKSASLAGIRIEIRSQKLLYGVLAFVIDYEIFKPDRPWGDDAKCGANKAKNPEEQIILRLAWIIWRNFLHFKQNSAKL